MAETHGIEREGIKILCKNLLDAGRTVEPSDDKTFDLMVDGQYAEVKAKSKGWGQFDFIALTEKQTDALGTKLKRIFLVLNMTQPDNVEIIEIPADDLKKCKCRKIVHYEWNKGAIRHLRERR